MKNTIKSWVDFFWWVLKITFEFWCIHFILSQCDHIFCLILILKSLKPLASAVRMSISRCVDVLLGKLHALAIIPWILKITFEFWCIHFILSQCDDIFCLILILKLLKPLALAKCHHTSDVLLSELQGLAKILFINDSSKTRIKNISFCLLFFSSNHFYAFSNFIVSNVQIFQGSMKP